MSGPEKFRNGVSIDITSPSKGTYHMMESMKAYQQPLLRLKICNLKVIKKWFQEQMAHLKHNYWSREIGKERGGGYIYWQTWNLFQTILGQFAGRAIPDNSATREHPASHLVYHHRSEKCGGNRSRRSIRRIHPSTKRENYSGA